MRKINVNVDLANKFFKSGEKILLNLIHKNFHINNNNSQKFSFFRFNNYFNKFQFKKFSSDEMQKLDPYLILEVNRGADFKTIKAAYFKLARLYHPDTNKNDEVKISFKKYTTLIFCREHKKNF